MKFGRNILKGLFSSGVILVAMSSCKDNFPTERTAFSLNMRFLSTEYKPILGQNNFYNDNFNSGESTLPLTFKMLNVRTYDGKDAPELLKPMPVKVWKDNYTGLEKSLEEIESKREITYRPIWEIGEHSGTFTMWNVAKSYFVRSEPDSCYLFDVEVSSTGGRRYFRDLKLKPQAEIEPSYVFVYGNVYGERTKTPTTAKIWFNRIGDGNSITFKFLDPQLNPIKLSKFNSMSNEDWNNLVHGFNKRFSNDSLTVTYDVAYPIPLVPTVPTKYNSGALARSIFNYNRVIYGGRREESSLSVLYNIQQEGDWEVVIYFPEEAPLFDND